jgi:hypothetical protein
VPRAVIFATFGGNPILWIDSVKTATRCGLPDGFAPPDTVANYCSRIVGDANSKRKILSSLLVRAHGYSTQFMVRVLCSLIL